jgi:hypothetical protein
MNLIFTFKTKNMKRKFKIAGIIALTLTLVCNLQYALLNYDVANNPSLASAAWTNSNGTVYCGTTGSTYSLVGTWVWQDNSDGHHTGGGYQNGYYIFYVYGGGHQCGAFNGDSTNIIPNGSGYQY